MQQLNYHLTTNHTNMGRAHRITFKGLLMTKHIYLGGVAVDWGAREDSRLQSFTLLDDYALGVSGAQRGGTAHQALKEAEEGDEDTFSITDRCVVRLASYVGSVLYPFADSATRRQKLSVSL